MIGRVPLVPIHVLSGRVEASLLGALAGSPHLHRAASIDDLAGILDRVAGQGAATEPRTLDLYGHATRGASLLRVGTSVIDATDRRVEACFRGLVRSGSFVRAGVRSVRLVGCGTATTEIGQLTIRVLSRILAVPVLGTTKRIMPSHYDAHGLGAAYAHLLVEARSVPRRGPFAA